MNQIRARHKQADGFKEFDIGNKCYYPRKTEVNESTTVNGRKVDVANYINREQIVGK